MVQIVNSLFADYLEPTGIADPRQTLLTGEQTTTTEPTITPIVQPLTDPTPTYEQQPLTKTLQEGFTKEPLVAQTSTPTKIVDPIDYVDPAATAFDPSMIDLDALANLDLSGLDTEALNNLTYQDVTSSLTGVSPAPTSAEGWANLYGQYAQTLGAGMSPNIDINDRTYAYNYALATQGGMDYQGTPEELRAAVGLPDTFSVYDNPQAGITTESAQGAYQALTSTADPMEALSQYYGIELQAATPNEQSVYTNADKYGTTAENMAEFQSVITPVLQQVIPYIQMTQGLRYDDALEYAYKNDPMVAAIYNKYGVDLFRQTNDGSTYFYDPFSGLEARTVEVKDTSFRDVGLALTGAALTAIVGPQIGAALGGTQTANAIGSAISSGLSTAATGGDVSDVLRSMATAGILNYGAAELVNNVDLQETLNQIGEEFGFGTTVEAVQESGSFVPSALTEQGLTGGSFTGSLAQVGAEAGKGLGDVLASVAQAIIDPSWTPIDLGDANIIINFANEAASNPELRESLDVGLDILRNMAQTAAEVYQENTGQTPELSVDLGIEFDPQQETAIEVDTETGVTTAGLPQPEITTEEITGENAAAADLAAAIESETDAGLRESLITEYENLTGQDYGSVEYIQPETQQTTDTVESQDVLESGGGMLTGGTTQPPADTTAPTVDTTAPTQYSQAEQQARNVLEYAVGSRGEYREDYDYDNDGRVTAADALMALKLGGVAKEDLFGYVETIFGSTVDDITASLDSIGDLEEQVTTGQEIIGAITDERDALAGQVTTLEGQLADAQAAADAAVAAGDANAAELQANADAIQEQLNATTAELDNANATITGLETELGTTQETLAATQEQLATTQEERDAAQTAVADLTGLLDTANVDLETKTAEIENLNTTVETLNTDIEVLTGDLDTANATVANLEEQLQTAKETNADNVADLESQLKDAQDNAAGIQESLDAKTTELDDANATIETLNGEVETLNTTVEDLNGQLEAKQGELDTANTTIADLTDKLGTSEAANVELTNQLNEANTEVATLEGNLETAQQTNTDLTNRLEEANTSVGSLTGQLEDANAELDALKDEYAAAVVANQENVDELEQAVKDKEGEVAGLEGDLADANATIEDLEGQLSDNEEEISGLEGSLADALATIAGLEGDLAASQAATETAIAEGVAAAEAAGEAGYETGYGEGEGVGRGLGAGIGLGLGMLAGQRSGGGGMFTPPQATTFMQQLPTDLTKVQLTPPTNARDYLAELIARLQA